MSKEETYSRILFILAIIIAKKQSEDQGTKYEFLGPCKGCIDFKGRCCG
jgi:hypothetical protein